MEYIFRANVEADPDGGFLVTFPDVPEAITHGSDMLEAVTNASEALGLALRGYVADGNELPKPTYKGNANSIEIPVEASDALKLAVVDAFYAARISKTELARRLGKMETEARRILDPDHPTKLPLLEAALAALGKQVVVTIRDAA
ncbi:type II toxin-antitoxin system HicB family antitoxin [Brucella intermedia]|uniref:type II toxin-antitoxin system HicB family antitoxin n=1 Tax=Brucella intermedia TaxID=94625 RepID=UPI002363060A|nr:type II toxin-antitoxin system HicB family antitoxin [Brucella intermedia]